MAQQWEQRWLSQNDHEEVIWAKELQMGNLRVQYLHPPNWLVSVNPGTAVEPASLWDLVQHNAHVTRSKKKKNTLSFDWQKNVLEIPRTKTTDVTGWQRSIF